MYVTTYILGASGQQSMQFDAKLLLSEEVGAFTDPRHPRGIYNGNLLILCKKGHTTVKYTYSIKVCPSALCNVQKKGKKN